jgi:hypothetical protein
MVFTTKQPALWAMKLLLRSLHDAIFNDETDFVLFFSVQGCRGPRGECERFFPGGQQ